MQCSVFKGLKYFFHYVYCRAATLYVSMNEGLSFISSSVTITTVSCVSIIINHILCFINCFVFDNQCWGSYCTLLLNSLLSVRFVYVFETKVAVISVKTRHFFEITDFLLQIETRLWSRLWTNFEVGLRKPNLKVWSSYKKGLMFR